MLSEDERGKSKDVVLFIVVFGVQKGVALENRLYKFNLNLRFGIWCPIFSV